MSSIGGLYNKAYGKLCGVHPHFYPWHFQWLATKDLYADLRRILPRLKGRVLDVGCRDKPYEAWLELADECFGIDISPGPKVDLVIEPGAPWSAASASFDAAICLQVLHYVADLKNFLGEIDRVLKPGGTLVLTVPFAYNQHTLVNDYWRFSVDGMRESFAVRSEIVEIKPQGGIGSTMGLLLLNWLDSMLNQYQPTRFMKGFLLPVWIIFCAVINALGWLLDGVDRTRTFYSNVLLVARKPCA
jgi:SAM-dependent methyltransferase